MDNQLLDFVVLALYFAVMIGAGYWGLRRARSAAALAAVMSTASAGLRQTSP